MARDYSQVEVLETVYITPQGQPQKRWRVTATTKGGVRFTVEVLDGDFAKEAVDKILTARAQQIDSVVTL